MKTLTTVAFLAMMLLLPCLHSSALGQGLLLDQDELRNKKTYTSLERALSEPGKVYKLSLMNKDLKELPAEIGKMVNLQVLYLNGNKLKELPTEMGELRNLQILNLYKNKLTEIPSFFKNFSHLEELYLANNKINRAPMWIARLRHVRTLDMTRNPLLFSEITYIREQLPKTQMSF